MPLTSFRRLYAIACASIADARTLVSAPGLLQRMERNLAAASGGAWRLGSAAGSLGVLMGTVSSMGAAVCTRIAEERDLLRALVLIMARGPRAPGGGPRPPPSIATEFRLGSQAAI